jgi:predicted SAM-dependent methyltransferase
VLEYLSLNNFRLAIKNTLDLLEPNSTFRLVVPDLKYLASQYINSSNPTASISFLKDAGIGILSKPRELKGLIQSWMGNGHHLWMWDYDSLALELEKAGFTNIRRAYFNDSEDLFFNDVEDQGRFIDAVAIQCKSPAL